MTEIDFTTDDGREFTVQYKCTHDGSPPNTYGLPEDCDPGEPAEFEIGNVFYGEELIQLSDAEEQRLLDKLQEEHEPDDEGWDVDFSDWA